MAAQGSLIYSSDYNTVVTKLQEVLGTGSPYGPGTSQPTYGYNQTLQSTLLTPSTKITATQWQLLQNDVNRCYTHQNGSAYSFTPLAQGQLITYAELAEINSVMSTCLTNKNSVAINQLTQTTLATVTYGSTWGSGASGISTTATVSFSNSSIMQYFVNQGGKIVIQGIGPTQNGTTQNSVWQTMLSSFVYTVDVVELGILTTSSQQRYYATSTNSTYSADYISLNAYYDVAGTLHFTIVYYDGHTGISDLVNSGAGFIVYQYSASGAFTGYQSSANSGSNLTWTAV
jgi:hypothetical protein